MLHTVRPDQEITQKAALTIPWILKNGSWTASGSVHLPVFTLYLDSMWQLTVELSAFESS